MLQRPTIGILGGGQLALMLLEAGKGLDASFFLWASSADDPAVRLCPDVTIGSYDDRETLRKFLGQCAIVLFESEFVPVQTLREVSQGLAVEFLPSLDVMGVAQNKLSQKEVLAAFGLPAARHEVWGSAGDLHEWIEHLLVRFPGGLVLKWATLGYDGKGNAFIRNVGYNRPSVARFVADAETRGSAVYAEELIPFSRELAVIGCGTRTGESASYPIVVSEQESGICRTVFGPAVEFGLSRESAASVAHIVHTLVTKLELVGCFGVELFETPERGILVNEIAPRVHNSGHYTQDAGCTSQFENHLRIALGLPLGSLQCLPGFAMRNLLGPEGIVREEGLAPTLAGEALSLHWYGKRGMRPRRKLGHLNGVAYESASVSEVLEEMTRVETRWIDALKKN